MLTTAELMAGMDSLQVRLLLSACSAIFILRVLDGRSSTSSTSMLISATALFLCYGVWLSSSGMVVTSCLVMVGLALVVEGWICLRKWTGATEAESHEEAWLLDAGQGSRKSKNQRLLKSTHVAPANTASPNTASLSTFASRPTEIWVCCLCVGVSALVLLLQGRTDTASGLIATLYTLHVLAAAVAGGVALACSIELTFFSSPDALRPATRRRVRWQAIAWVALLVFLAELGASAGILFAPVDKEAGAMVQLFPRVFALSLMVVNFVAWMVPHRVAAFQRSGEATQWTSLTLASWLGVLGLLVVNTLPSNWPWDLLR